MNLRYRKTVFMVAYSAEGNKIYYLVLKRKLHWIGWEFPKGGIEKNETPRIAVEREIFEETGLKPLEIKCFNYYGKYEYEKKFPERPGFIGQSYSLYAVRLKKGRIKIDAREHTGFKWLPFAKAFKTITFQDQKKCLKIVNDWLIKMGMQGVEPRTP